MRNKAKIIHPRLGENIRVLRIKTNLTQKSLAEMLYKSESAVRMWELGKSEPDNETLLNLASIFNVSVDYLLGKEHPIIKSNLTELPQHDIRMIPIYESVSAGTGAEAEDNVIDYMPFIIQNETEAQNTIFIKVKGDSMYPKIEDGDLILVHKQDAINSGSIGVILLDGEALVKKIIYDRHHIELQSVNPLYPPIKIQGQDIERIHIIGLVRKIIKNV